MAGPLVYVGPDEAGAGGLLEAVERGGGRIAGGPEEAEAIVWHGSRSSRLQEILHPGIRWVQIPSAGVESWLEKGLIDDERVFTSAVGAYAEPVAEHALALMLAGARRLHECARARSWGAGMSRRPLTGSTVVVLGAGGIGQALIRMLRPLSVQVVAVTRGGREVPGADESLAATEMDGVWAGGDFFVVAAPATPSTRHLIGESELEAMPSHAWVVNIARGSLIDTDALVGALASGSIGGAALDVTDPEPLPDGHPLWSEPNALITPHSANPPAGMDPGLAQRVEENVARFAAGEPLVGRIDLEAGY